MLGSLERDLASQSRQECEPARAETARGAELSLGSRPVPEPAKTLFPFVDTNPCLIEVSGSLITRLLAVFAQAQDTTVEGEGGDLSIQFS